MNARLYARIMKHLEKTSGTSSWDFRTLNQAHPQLAGYLFGILANVMGDYASDIVILNHYAPSRLWAWDGRPFITNEIYHYHDVARLEDQCAPECFDLTRSEIDANLESESEEFRAWILSNPAVGDKFYGNGFNADVFLIERRK